jgi:alkylation response protein AidB-like acyl-CoA dehydrogenase
MKINSPDDSALTKLCDRLAAAGADLDRSGRWPAEQLRWCGEAGVFEWFLDSGWGGQDWNDEQTVRGYLALAAACLTTTFILTQRTGACRRIAGCQNKVLKERLLPGLVSGQLFATVGISHLTTSRRHLGRPVLIAEETATGFRLEGLSPWVTGAAAADAIVIAATLTENGQPTNRELLIAVPKEAAGLSIAEPLPLVGV